MSDLSEVQVGDVLYVRNATERRDPAFTPPTITVTKVGPKRIGYMTSWGKLAYVAKADGHIDDWTWLETPAFYAEAKERAAIIARLRDAGIELGLGSQRGISTDTLRRLLAVIEEVSV